MPINTSWLQNLTFQQPQIDNPIDIATKAANLKALGLQNQQTQLGVENQQAIKAAYANNVNQDGTVNQQGVLSELAKNAPQAYMQTSQAQSAMNKSSAESQQEQIKAAQARDGQIYSHLQNLNSVPSDQKQNVWSQSRNDLISQGIIKPQDVPETYDQGFADRLFQSHQQSAQYLQDQQTKAKTQEALSNVATGPAKLNAELYGSRSPNAELSSQYGKDVAPIRSSQVYMAQMLDSHQNKTPQGDAALVVNNFRIRNPQATDVNSIQEMKDSQAVSDAWKNRLNSALQGGFDDATRDNLIRDGISAYRANYNTFQGIQKRYQARAAQQNVNDPSLTYEPAIQNTWKEASDLQNKLGPYQPPSQRGGGGIVSSITKGVSSLLGSKPAEAAAVKLPPPPKDSIWMRSPRDGTIKAVPLSQKGEAIASGGSVVGQ